MKNPEIVKHRNLDERTVQLGILGMWVCEQLPRSYVGRNVADQLFRSVTSVAANYAEASEPESDEDFIHKLKVALKELKETRVWMRFAKIITQDVFIDLIIGETFEIARMIGASMKKRGYSGWSSK